MRLGVAGISSDLMSYFQIHALDLGLADISGRRQHIETVHSASFSCDFRRPCHDFHEWKNDPPPAILPDAPPAELLAWNITEPACPNEQRKTRFPKPSWKPISLLQVQESARFLVGVFAGECRLCREQLSLCSSQCHVAPMAITWLGIRTISTSR